MAEYKLILSFILITLFASGTSKLVGFNFSIPSETLVPISALFSPSPRFALSRLRLSFLSYQDASKMELNAEDYDSLCCE
jgi:hypothetical protein